MRKLSLLAILVLGILALVAKPASATIIDVCYTWYSTGGTRATVVSGDPSESWTSGDISGVPIMMVHEYWVSGDQRPTGDFAGHGMFRYDIHRIPETQHIYDFKIYNPYQVSYLGTKTTEGALNWTAAHTADYWYWSTTTDPIDGAAAYFYIYTDAPRGIIRRGGEGSDYNSGHHVVFASGLLSGPVPEPTSLLLLGSGLLGLAAIGGLRRRKA